MKCWKAVNMQNNIADRALLPYFVHCTSPLSSIVRTPDEVVSCFANSVSDTLYWTGGQVTSDSSRMTCKAKVEGLNSGNQRQKYFLEAAFVQILCIHDHHVKELSKDSEILFLPLIWKCDIFQCFNQTSQHLP